MSNFSLYPVSNEVLEQLPPHMRAELLLDAALFLYRAQGYILTSGVDYRADRAAADILDHAAARCSGEANEVHPY